MSADNVAPVDHQSAPTTFYKLESRDQQVVEMSKEAIEQSKTLSDFVSNLQKEPIPVYNVNGTTLKLVAKWCEHHKGEPIPVDDDNVPKNITIPEWDRDFLNISNDELLDLISASNYLDIKGLMNYGCKKVADMAKGKSPEELRIIYGIPTDEAEERAAMERAEAEFAAMNH